MPELSTRTSTFTDSVIRRMTRISNQYGAVNLSQGFPDFEPPREILERLDKNVALAIFALFGVSGNTCTTIGAFH